MTRQNDADANGRTAARRRWPIWLGFTIVVGAVGTGYAYFGVIRPAREAAFACTVERELSEALLAAEAELADGKARGATPEELTRLRSHVEAARRAADAQGVRLRRVAEESQQAR